MINFYSVLYNRFASFQIDQVASARLLYPFSSPRPFIQIGNDISDCLVGIPPIKVGTRQQQDSCDSDVPSAMLSYGPFNLVDGELGRLLATRLIFASSSILGAKSILGWIYYDSLKDWARAKPDPGRASYTANIILDSLASHLVGQVEGAEYYKSIMRQANFASASLLSNYSKDGVPSAVQASAAAMVLAGQKNMQSAISSQSILKLADDFTATTTSFAPGILAVIDECGKNIQNADPEKTREKLNSFWKAIGAHADTTYAMVEKIPDRLSWQLVSNPYSATIALSPSSATEPWKRNTSSGSGGDSYKKIVIDPQEVYSNLYGKHDGNWAQDDDGENLEFFSQMLAERQKEMKLVKKIGALSSNLNFENVGFPIGDYTSYYRTFTALSSQIRRMVERIRSVKNVLDEKLFEETGFIDLQAAIQSIASDTPRNDLFMKDENLLKSESWTILVDSSSSLSGVRDTVRAVSVCLAEVAREILGPTEWGMFAFSDEFLCLKDFSEPYDNRIKSRIGGLTQKGLSYIPDAIRIASNLIPGSSSERNYLILVSDGIPSGYRGIEEQFKISLKELKKHGATFSAIGIGSNAIRKVVQKARIINEPSEVMKQFVDMYYEISA